MDGPRRVSHEYSQNSTGPVCPFCNCQHIADEAIYYDEGTTRLDCDHCGREFNVRVYNSTTWTTNLGDTP